MQDRLLAVDDQGMPGIMSALEAHHGGGPIRQQIDDLPFALVTPLGTYYDQVFSHAQYHIDRNKRGGSSASQQKAFFA
jgi:hypothetical protein